ncbi:MAG: chemotaxis protein CheZ [Rhodanobacter sp.]|nr:MAG: chemotaxis protein CheZ [Rhodanobacter sp.]TAM13796.1 MAG: chemotaxis protein CheZ [Rhodanobacter sp.]TAM37707.1 MAG: chemotaxis protein CheZ [Rhodanobacter sp.]
MNAKQPMAMDAALPPQLRELLNSPDGAAFEKALDEMVRQRELSLFRALGKLARDLHDAVRRLGGDLAEEGVPGIVADARQHLQEVLEMSASAANRSLDLAERLRPQAALLAERAADALKAAPGDALAGEAATFAENCRTSFANMVVAQSWQDLSGQRIKKVATFIGSVETSLLELVRLTGALAGDETAKAEVEKVTSQEDADRLLSEFGF